MKRLLVIAIIIGIAINLNSQVLVKSRIDSIAYDLAYTKYNIGKFKTQTLVGYTVTSIGLLSIPASRIIFKQPAYPTTLKQVSDYPKLSNDWISKIRVADMISGGIVLLGTIITLDSYSWLKRASLKPSNYGVSFTYDLDKDFE